MIQEKLIRKDEIYTIQITDMDAEGQGIGKAEGFTLFVKDAFIGDTVEVRVMKAKKHYGYAKLLRVIEPSSDRVEAACPNARACGGCQLQELSYEAELRFKENKVQNHLVRIGGFDEKFIEEIREPIVGMENPERYRNKAQYPVGTDREGKPIAGFYAGRTHSIIPNTDCLLGRQVNRVILEKILSFMREEGIQPYDEVTGKGWIRHVLIREGFSTGQIMVCLVVNGAAIPKEEKLVKKLQAILPRIASICLNINTEKTNVILGEKTRVLFGEESIEDVMGGIVFKISATSFYQVNPVQAGKLYKKVLQYAALTGHESVWDLYCGIGTISLFLAQKAGKVYGVEIVPEAIEDARANAGRNGITNAEFFVGKAEEVLPAFYERRINGNPDSEEGKSSVADKSNSRYGEMLHPNVIVVDPPRKGCDEKCLETMLLMEPERIVYVSCDSATLARDLKILCAEKYELKAWQCYDQFCRTVHCEVVVSMSRVESRQ